MAGVRVAALAIFFSIKFFCVSIFGQSDPLNSWTQVWSGNALLRSVSSLANGNGLFIGVGNGARVISNDGSNWTTFAGSPIFGGSPGVAFGGGIFVMFGTNVQSNANYIFKSGDGTSWTNVYTSSNTLASAAYGNNTWVFIGTNEIVTATLTSSNWNWTEFQPAFSPGSIIYANGNFVLVGLINNYNGIVVFTSSDGITWQYDSTINFNTVPNTDFLGVSGIAYGNGVFVTSILNAGSSGGNNTYYILSEAFASSNLLQWNPSWTGSTNFGPQAIAYGGNEFAGSFLGNIFTSLDGLTWTNRFNGYFNAFAYGQGTFVAAGENTNSQIGIYQSGQFTSVSNGIPTTLSISTYPALTINGTAGATYQIQYNTNLNSTWLPLTNFSLPYSPFIWVDTSSIISGQKFYRSVQLQ